VTTMTATYLDFAATTPVDPRVAEVVMRHMLLEYGNAGSRTHEYGARAAKAVERARAQVAQVVDADVTDVIFTSGATEANNLALLGLADEGMRNGRTHIVTTAIEHKAVLEPLAVLGSRGFTVEIVAPESSGAVNVDAVLDAIRPNTLLVSVMHVNNETGVRQPVDDIASRLEAHPGVFLHTDAAQGFGKELRSLEHRRIDMISVSGHKLFAPKGVGALILRRRDRKRPPLAPLMFGGGQERGLRPGTLPVALIAGLGLAAELALTEHDAREDKCRATRVAVLDALLRVGAVANGDQSRTVPHIVNVSLPDLDSEAAMLALKEITAISNGSACTSASYEPSHVLQAMGLGAERERSALRFSWGPDTTPPDVDAIERAIRPLL